MGVYALGLVLRAWTTSTIARFLLILMIKMVSEMIHQVIIPRNLNSTLISRCLTAPQSLADQSQAALTLTSLAPMTAGEVDHIEGADSNGIIVFATLMSTTLL